MLLRNTRSPSKLAQGESDSSPRSSTSGSRPPAALALAAQALQRFVQLELLIPSSGLVPTMSRYPFSHPPSLAADQLDFLERFYQASDRPDAIDEVRTSLPRILDRAQAVPPRSS